jgi:hypothetical protein
MPAISRFFGIVVSLYYNDHQPPHFHVKYAEHRASMTIETLEIHEGSIPRRVRLLATEWAIAHRDELRANWERARAGLPLEAVPPLE